MELNEQHSTPGQSIQQLLRQYLKVLTRPSARTFLEEKHSASWGSVWLQLIGLGIIGTLLQVLYYLLSPSSITNIVPNSRTSFGLLMLALAIALIVFTPISFFIGVGILHLIAKAFGGRGRYLEQLYVTLLFGVPLVTLSYLLLFIPLVGNRLAYLPHIYSLVLFVPSLMAVHSLSRGKAIAVVLIPFTIAILLIVVITFVVILTAAFVH